jgi:hypothetical protein
VVRSFDQNRAANSDGSPSVLTHVATGSAIVFVSLLLVGALAIASVPASIAFGDAPLPGADFARQLTQLGMGAILAPGALAAAVFIAATSKVGAAAGILPRTVAVLGYVAAVLLLFGAFFLPLLALPIWTIVVGIALSRHPVPATAPRARTGASAPTPSPV